MFLRSTASSALALGLLLLGGARGQAQGSEPDPCASAPTLGAVRQCWAVEVERADGEMREALAAALNGLPRARADALKKSQKAWLEFRDAQVRALYGETRYDIELFTCALIARRQLTRARTAELQRMLRDKDNTQTCPL